MPDARVPPAFCLSSPAGMRAEHCAHGGLRRLDCGATCLSLWIASEVEGSPANLYLRRQGDELEWTALLGPQSPTRFCMPADGRLVGRGTWHGVKYTVVLVLAQGAPAWFWHVRLESTHSTAQHLDLTYAQDVALAPYWAVRLNELYVSQYIDHSPLEHPIHGVLVASRQNLAAEGRHPWCLIGSLRTGTSFATDALQLHGLARRAGDAPPGLAADLPGRRLQHEHSMVVIRDAPLSLEPHASASAGFFGFWVGDHPEASGSSDLDRVSGIMALPEALPVLIEPDSDAPAPEIRTLFSSAPRLTVRDLDPDELRAFASPPWRHEETDERGELLSFFHGAAAHVVLKLKELRVLRPHGQILRTGRHVTPDETGLTSTVWMGGVFHSMLTQGHVSLNRLLSTVHGYLGLFRSHGQRVFVQLGSTWHLLDVPSAFEMSPARCRWLYRHDAGLIEVCAAASSESPELTLSVTVSSGPPLRCLITHHLGVNGDDGSTRGPVHFSREGEAIRIVPAPGSELAKRFPHGAFCILPEPGTVLEQVTTDELLFLDGHSRQEPYLCLVTAPSNSVGLRIRAELIPANAQQPLYVEAGTPLIPTLSLTAPAGSPLATPVAQLAEIFPWLTQNALVHHLSPRGLEQYSGGGWGTRDVCQGPVEMLLALGRLKALRALLITVMAAQNPDGDWPQWFTFFERDRDIRAGDAHGDIVLWPLVALAQYLEASGDASILDEIVPVFSAGAPGAGERASVWGHVQRALACIRKRVIPGTALLAYGHGDWNDSLQPADPMLRERMCSSWTVTLHVRALTSLASALGRIGRHPAEAARLKSWARNVQRDFERLLLVDGVLAGYAVFAPGGRVRYLLHPRDEVTGVRFSALAMVHAILEDMLTPHQAREHLKLMDMHLIGPDGLRLLERPFPYHGGPERIFQRAESAAFFGREIGLMYMHAHLRYAQALAHVGEAERFFHALCHAHPIGIRSLVPTASLRQANCYYSSSDAAFEDRDQASREYERIAQGTVALEGGWRVYSSGAGIALALIMQSFLGLTCLPDAVRIDPVIPAALDGLCLMTSLLGRPVEVRYRVGQEGCGVKRIAVNGQPLSVREQPGPYRPCALVSTASLLTALEAAGNTLSIELG